MAFNKKRYKKIPKRTIIDMKKQAKLIADLRDLKPKTFDAVAKPTLDALSIYAKNILKQNLKTSPSQLEKLRSYKDEMRELAKRTTGLRRRRMILQKGGFFPLLMRIVAPIISSLLG